MLKNYIKTAWRNLWKGRIFNAMNVVGLSVAIACCTLLFLTVHYEFSYDRFHTNLKDIYQVYSVSHRPQGDDASTSMPVPFLPALKAEYPEVKYVSRSANSGVVVRYANKELDLDAHYVDEDFLKMFTFPLAKGNSSNVLSGLNNVVLTEEAAKSIFGNQEPIGKTILLKIEDKPASFMVTGVAKSIPSNSGILFDMLIRFENNSIYKDNINQWDNWTHLVFVQMKEDFDPSTFTRRMQPFTKKHFTRSIEALKSDGAKPDADGNVFSLHLAPFANNHFSVNMGGTEGSPVSKIYVISLLIVGCFILIIACINFINLSIARAFTRSREVGVRKTLGAGKWQLLTQFWIETVMVCLGATMLGVLLAGLTMPTFKAIFRSHITIGMLLQPAQLSGCIMLFALITVIAGFYPALIMIRYKTVSVLKGNMVAAKPGKLRNSLLVVQFSLSTLLTICTIITWQQIHYLQSKPLGYNKMEVLSIPTGYNEVGSNVLQIMRNKLGNDPAVLSVSGAYNNMGRGTDGSMRTSIQGFNYKGHEIRTHIERVDYDYLQTMDIKLLEGRDFSRTYSGDTTAIVINEAMAAKLGGKNLVGSFLPMNDDKKPAQIIGIVKNYNFRSLHEEIEPLTLTMNPEYSINYVYVKVKPASLVQTFDRIQKSWHAEFTNTEFRGSWLNENTERQYQGEKRLSGIFVSGAIIAIIISCIGLLAISIMIVMQRNKEIGIRKVLGASVTRIVFMLSGDFVKLVLLAAFIAFPVAWWLMDRWLQGFAYRIHLQWWVFAAAALLAMLVAFITISFQAIKAAVANPVKSLRSE
ncbi:ABC transporter permease [Mucilaginibacter sp. Bleaf8]|uniref:ABC transporter permease n=1 Tax=Mucilaginibacter sp. Bleaf8 TaxID=2834430 RepID=UPI001BCD8013|nr:ABC transporter permease [Mucilaginibacter sp. Bleaf8]MBS7563360.1 ABC transporter permease [Mucilaginibacter sp. Bleaf8]